MGFPSLFVINDKLMPRTNYVNRIIEISKDTSKLTNMKNTMTGKAFYEVINNDVFIQHDVKHIFHLRPTFIKYTESDEVCKNMNRTNILTLES